MIPFASYIFTINEEKDIWRLIFSDNAINANSRASPVILTNLLSSVSWHILHVDDDLFDNVGNWLILF